MFLRLRIVGHLDSRWSDWFEGLELRHLPEGDTEFSGPVVDQAALYGLLNRAGDLGLTLLSLSLETTGPSEVDDSKWPWPYGVFLVKSFSVCYFSSWKSKKGWLTKVN